MAKLPPEGSAFSASSSSAFSPGSSTAGSNASFDSISRSEVRPLPSSHDPGLVAPLLGETVVQYVQGTGDPWGEMAVVEEFSRRTPRSLGVLTHPSTGRYEGYRYITERAADVVAFFDEHV